VIWTARCRSRMSAATWAGATWRPGGRDPRGGDVSLKTVFAGPHTYRVQAGGDGTIRALPGSNATSPCAPAGDPGQGADRRLRRAANGAAPWQRRAKVELTAGGQRQAPRAREDVPDEDFPFFDFCGMGAMMDWGMGDMGPRIRSTWPTS